MDLDQLMDQDQLTDQDPAMDMDQDPSKVQVSVYPPKPVQKKSTTHQQDLVYSHMDTNQRSKAQEDMYNMAYMPSMVDMAFMVVMVDIHKHHPGFSDTDTKVDQLSSRRSPLRNRAHITSNSLFIAMLPRLLKVHLFQAIFTKSTEEEASLVTAMSSPITFSIMIIKLLPMLSVLNPMLLLLLMLAKSLLLILLNLIMDIQMARSDIKLLNSRMMKNPLLILTSLSSVVSNKPKLIPLANPAFNSKKVDKLKLLLFNIKLLSFNIKPLNLIVITVNIITSHVHTVKATMVKMASTAIILELPTFNLPFKLLKVLKPLH